MVKNIVVYNWLSSESRILGVIILDLSNEFGFRPCTSSMFSNDTFYFNTIENIKVKWFGISLVFI